MANKRQLKRTINSISGGLLAECVAIRHFQSTNPDDVDNIMLAVLRLQDDLICRISHPEPGMSARKFFKKLTDDLKTGTEGIMEQIENAI